MVSGTPAELFLPPIPTESWRRGSPPSPYGNQAVPSGRRNMPRPVDRASNCPGQRGSLPTRASWGVGGRFGVVVRRVPIRAPILTIPVHVVKPEGVGDERTHRSREHKAVAGPNAGSPGWEPRLECGVSHVADPGQRFWIVAAVIPRLGPGATSVFPLGFCWQPVHLALPTAEPPAEGHRVVQLTFTTGC